MWNTSVATIAVIAAAAAAPLPSLGIITNLACSLDQFTLTVIFFLYNPFFVALWLFDYVASQTK